MTLSQRLLTVKDVATFLSINPLTVYEYIRAGKLPAIKLGRNYRVTEEDLRVFIAAHKTEAPHE